MAVADKPFYQRWWFLVIIALVGVILILITVGVLWVTGKRRRNRKSQYCLTTCAFST